VDLTADQFNDRYPIGTPVIAYPGIRPEYAKTIGSDSCPRLETRTRSHAWNLGHGEPVVLVDDYAGGISLEHIDVVGQPGDVNAPCFCGKPSTPNVVHRPGWPCYARPVTAAKGAAR
jgi:hypothetical protein